jgi:nucleoside-diphosphate-sugar epimerase
MGNQKEGVFKNFWCYPDEPVTLRGLVHEFEVAADSTLDVEWGSRDYRPGERFEIENGKRNRVPGWAPKVSLEQGLKFCMEKD